jgi:PAP2 superfamily
MPRRATTLQERFLPHGPLDLVRQVLLFMAAYQLYRLTRGFVNDPEAATVAFNHARELISVERTLNVFIEPSVQTFTAGQDWLLDIASWMYINAQTTITLSALVWLYLFRNASFYFVRNMFLFAFCLALVGYGLFPTAPPRFLPEWGFFDAVSDFTGVPQDSVTVDALFNPYAAMPSMHVGFALMISIPLARLVRWRGLKVFWSLYPLIVVWVIVSTANHFILDAVFGAVTAGIGALFALGMARLRPAVWSFRPPPRQAPVERDVALSTA